jgi:hypothetical protein
MKFLKTKNISKWSTNDRTMIVYPDGNGPGTRVVFNANGGMMLPKGSTAERPQLTGVRQPTDANGTIRYNTTTSSIEAYVGNAWEVVRAPGASVINKQTLVPLGDDVETVFGTLNESYLSSFSASDDNIIVLVENVFQLSVTNYTVEQSIGGNLTGPNAPYADGWYIKFTSPVPSGKAVTVYHGYSN